MKGVSGVYRQEPFNEVIAAAIMQRLGIPHVKYTLTFEDDKPFCLCENSVTPDTELVPAYRVRESLKKIIGILISRTFCVAVIITVFSVLSPVKPGC